MGGANIVEPGHKASLHGLARFGKQGRIHIEKGLPVDKDVRVTKRAHPHRVFGILVQGYRDLQDLFFHVTGRWGKVLGGQEISQHLQGKPALHSGVWHG